MIVRGRLTALPADTPVPNGTVGTLRRSVDNSLITTVTTTDGWYTYQVDGNPGPFSVEWVYGGVTHRSYSKITGPSAATDIAGLPVVLQAFKSGIIGGVGANLAVTATGSGMNVTVGSGAALVKGVLYDRYTSATVAVAASHATLGRLDYIVIRVVPQGSGENIEGKSELVVITGTPATTPALPALTQTTSLYEFAIGYVTVDAAVTTIASNKVAYSSTSLVGATPPSFGVNSSHLDSNSVTAFAIAADAVGASELADNSVASANIINGTIAATDLASDAVYIATYREPGGTAFIGHANRLDFEGGLYVEDVGGALRKKVTVKTGGVTEVMLATAVQNKLNSSYTGNPSMMPGTGYVATGSLSSGARTLVTMAVGPLLSGVVYDISCKNGCTLRGTGNTGTVNLRANINGGVQREIELQHVGGVPRWGSTTQTASITGAGVAINVTGSVVYLTGDPCDIRAGEITVIAIPR